MRVGRDDAQGADGTTLIRRRQPPPSTVQSFCFTFKHRLVAPPPYTLASSSAEWARTWLDHSGGGVKPCS